MSSTLTFTRFRVWQVSVPGRHEIVYAPPSQGALYEDNLTWPALPIHLIEGETSAGFVALGECERNTPRAVVEATLHALLGRDLLTMTPATIWSDPSSPEGLPLSYPTWSWQTPAGKSYPILESLWLDAMGKALGAPAHVLLGGAVRDAVVVDFWANRPDARTMAALIQEARDRGLKGIKMKCDSTGDTVASLTEIAADIPQDFRVTVDPMIAWRSLRESARYFEQLADLPCAVQVEDPFPWDVDEDWQRARQLYPVTIICHARNEDVFRRAMKANMADAYNLGGAGAYDFVRMAQLADMFFKDCWQGSSLELGVLQHLRLHAAACARNCVLASDLSSEFVREHTLITPRMEYRGDTAVVPNRPGLGVDLDHAAVERYCRDSFVVE